jgi:hypothetical protein
LKNPCNFLEKSERKKITISGYGAAVRLKTVLNFDPHIIFADPKYLKVLVVLVRGAPYEQRFLSLKKRKKRFLFLGVDLSCIQDPVSRKLEGAQLHISSSTISPFLYGIIASGMVWNKLINLTGPNRVVTGELQQGDESSNGKKKVHRENFQQMWGNRT